MAIRFMDGFDKYHSTNNTDISVALARNYTSVVASDSNKIQAGRFGGHALQINNYKNWGSISKAISASGVSRFIIGFNLKFMSGGINDRALSLGPSNASVYGGGTSRGLTVRRDGVLAYNTGVLNMTYGTLTNNTWYHIEMIWPITTSVGNPVKLYVDGAEVASDTTSAGNIAWNGTLLITSNLAYSTNASCIDDLYVLDDTGSTNNTRISSLSYIPRIETMYPTSTVANDFTITGGGTAHQTLDNVPVNTGQYISSTTTSHKARFEVGDLTNINNIKGVQFGAVCSNTTTANDDWKFLMNNTEVGTTKTVTDLLSNSTQFTEQIFETNI